MKIGKYGINVMNTNTFIYSKYKEAYDEILSKSISELNKD